MSNRELLLDMGYEDMVVFENPDYDEAIMGVTAGEDRVVYSYTKMVECLMERDNMTADEAMEFIDYNTIRALPYMQGAPVVVYDLM